MQWNVFVIFILCVVCQVTIAHDEKSTSERLVYGADNRVEPYTITDTDILNLIQADVAITYAGYLAASGSTYNIVSSGTFTSGSSCGSLCTTEKFYGQMTLPFCSGFLVSSTQIVTAGHCVSGQTASNLAVIFDFKQQSSSLGPQTTGIPQNNVYFGTSFTYAQNASQDWGVLTLDRAVVGRYPLPIRRSGAPSVGDGLILIGHPSGLPMKVAAGASVQNWGTGSLFSANCDSYAGNSGSMIVNAATMEVEGILVNGNTDFVTSGSCCVSNVCPDSGCPGWEGITKISYIASQIPYVSPSATPSASPSTGASSSPSRPPSSSPSTGSSPSASSTPSLASSASPTTSPMDEPPASKSQLSGTMRLVVGAIIIAVGFAAIVGIVTLICMRRRRNKKVSPYEDYRYEDTTPSPATSGGTVPVMALSDIQNTKMKVIDPDAPPGGFTKGMHVQARYSGDGKFYPAVIVDYSSQSNQFLVQYPDYDGYQEWVLQTSLRK